LASFSIKKDGILQITEKYTFLILNYILKKNPRKIENMEAAI